MLNNYKNKLADFYLNYNRMPTYTEMLKLFNFKSKNAVFKIVQKMIQANIVAKDHLGRLIPSESFSEIPILGLVQAGFPSEASQELRETLNLENFLVQKRENTFMLEVDGDSMIEAHIKKGDHVLVEKNNQARDGDIVIAEVDGEFTMKYFKKQGNKVWLQPANKKLKNIYPKYSLNINAIVKAVIRKY